MTSPKGKVLVRVDKYLEGANIEFGVPVQFRPVIDLPENTAGRRTDRSRKLRTVIAPVTYSSISMAKLELDAGAYDVEAILPSGEMLSKEITVKSGKEKKVVLRGESSPNEWRSWSHFSGANLMSTRRKIMENPERGKLSDFTVSIGGAAWVPGVEKQIDPSRWEDWFEFLQARFQKREEVMETCISLTNNHAGLVIKSEGGFDGLPMRISIVEQHQISVDPRTVGDDRVYVSVSSESGCRVFTLPWPWPRGRTTLQGKLFDVMAVEDEGKLRCDPVLLDERWGGLLAYVNSGRIHLAAEILAADILQMAKEALFEKFENPLAAVVAGYVLLSTNQESEGERWPAWLANLAERFPNLPDGAILRARWLLQQGGEANIDQARQLLFKSIERGVPYFTIGVAWLIEEMEQVAIDSDACTEKLARIRGVARSMDLSQAFTSFTIANPERMEAIPEPINRVGTGADLVESTRDETSADLVEATQEVCH